MEILKTKIKDLTFVAFDTETSGAFPLKDDIVEFGAVKWRDGKEIDRLEFLFKPKEPMSDFIISIHKITNEMVQDAPLISTKINQIRDFFQGAVGVAHHAPFDLGFVTIELDKNKLTLPTEPVLCTSLLSRKLITGVINHKLQTLIQHFNFPSLAAHRAYEDARACMFVLFECFKKMDSEATLADAIKIQEKMLNWTDYSFYNQSNGEVKTIIQAIENQKNIEMLYKKGQKKDSVRILKPLGIVKSPDGDYMQAFDPIENKNKRFFLEFVKDVQILFG